MCAVHLPRVVLLAQMQSPAHTLMPPLEAVAVLRLILLFPAWMLLVLELGLAVPWLLLVLVLLSRRVCLAVLLRTSSLSWWLAVGQLLVLRGLILPVAAPLLGCLLL